MPVYVHVINKGQTLADGNVPDSQIQQQITVLNQTFNGMRGGADTNFNFVLRDIDRTTNEAWFNMAASTSEERAAKRALHEGGPDALNIYIAEGGGYLGWAYYPKDVAGSNGREYIDGIVIAFGSLPGGEHQELQPRVHRHARGRALDRALPHVPERLLGRRRPDRRHAAPALPDLGLPRGPGLVPGAGAGPDPQLHGLLLRRLLHGVHVAAGDAGCSSNGSRTARSDADLPSRCWRPSGRRRRRRR